MTKNTEERGETKSAPKEIPKLARETCIECGLTGPVTMVHEELCINRLACARRVRRQASRP